MDAKAKTKARISAPKKAVAKAVEQKRAKPAKNPVVKQESFRDKLKRKFNLFQTKAKDTKSTSSKKSDLPARITSSTSSKQPKGNSQAKDKPDKLVGAKQSPQAEKARTPPKREPSAEREKSKPGEVQKSTVAASEPKKKSSQTSLALDNSDSSDSMESTEDITPTVKPKTKADKVKPQGIMDTDQGISIKGSQIASKLPKKKEEFKFEVHSNLGESVIASPSAWMEFRAYKGPGKAAMPETTSKPIRLPDNID